MLVQRRDRLLGHLAADPVGLLGEDDGPAGPCCRQSSRHAAAAAADDRDIGLALGGSPGRSTEDPRQGKWTQAGQVEEEASVHACKLQEREHFPQQRQACCDSIPTQRV